MRGIGLHIWNYQDIPQAGVFLIAQHLKSIRLLTLQSFFSMDDKSNM